METVKKATDGKSLLQDNLQDLPVPKEQTEAKGGRAAGAYSSVSGRITGIAVDPTD